MKFNPMYWMKSPGDTPKGDHREFINPDWIPWTDWLMPGTRFKLLFCDLVSGHFTMLLQVDEGVQAIPHWHVHNIQAIILEGGFFYDDGDDKGMKGYYTCEMSGNVHKPFAPEGCLMFAVSHGPIGGYTDEGDLVVMADARLHYYMARENNAIKHTMIVDYKIGSTEMQT